MGSSGRRPCFSPFSRNPEPPPRSSLRTAGILRRQKGHLLFQSWHRLRAERYMDICPVISAGLNVNFANFQKLVGKLLQGFVDFKSFPLAVGAMHGAKFIARRLTQLSECP